MEKRKRYGTLFGIAVFFLLFLLQVLSGMAGSFVADRIPFEKIDPYDSFARISIHHAVITAISVIVIVLMRKRLKIDFYIQLGDKEKGKRYLGGLGFRYLRFDQGSFFGGRYRLRPVGRRHDCGRLLRLFGGSIYDQSGESRQAQLFFLLPVCSRCIGFGGSIIYRKNILRKRELS